MGFLPYEADVEVSTLPFHTMVTEKLSINMDVVIARPTLCPVDFLPKLKLLLPVDF